MHVTRFARLSGSIILTLGFAVSATSAQDANMTSSELIEMSREVQEDVERETQ